MMSEERRDRGLPELPDASVDRIESGVFAEIGHIRRTSARRRRGVLAGLGSVAAVAVVAAVLVPAALSGGGDGGVTADRPSAAQDRGGSDGGEKAQGPDGTGESETLTQRDTSGQTDPAQRQVISTATASLTVDDVPHAVTALADLAERHDGYVEAEGVSDDGPAPPEDGEPVEPGVGDQGTAEGGATAGAPGGWITVRLPADQLRPVIDALAEHGEVTATEVTRSDVTAEHVDLEARVTAAQTSVDRLTALMAQAGNVSELLEAENALAQRQGELESLQQQLASLDDQVAMSSLQVQLAATGSAAHADPAGFGDGLLAGWNGVIAAWNGVVVGAGFLLPWLGIALVAALVVLVIVIAVRRRRA